MLTGLTGSIPTEFGNLTNLTVLLATFHLKLEGTLWVYPALVFNYSLVGTRVAVWANIALCLSVWYLAGSWAEWPLWPRIVVTMAISFLCSLFCCGNTCDYSPCRRGMRSDVAR